jgi:hypothetical protein
VSNLPGQETFGSDVDHSFGAVDALLVIAHETAHVVIQANVLHYPSTRDDLEALGRIGSLLRLPLVK